MEFEAFPIGIESKRDFWFVWKEDPDTVFHATEGDGTNLTDEDVAAGHVDYIYYDEHDAAALKDACSGGGLDEDAAQGTVKDGGMVLLDRPYGTLSAEAIALRTLNLARGVEGLNPGEDLLTVVWDGAEGEAEADVKVGLCGDSVALSEDGKAIEGLCDVFVGESGEPYADRVPFRFCPRTGDAFIDLWPAPEEDGVFPKGGMERAERCLEGNLRANFPDSVAECENGKEDE